MNVKGEKVVSWMDAKKILLAREKEGELGYEQKNALDHLRKFCKLTEKKYKELVEGLKQIEKLKEKHIVNIVNFLPQSPDELRVLFQNERIVLSDDEKKHILDMVKNILG